MGDISSCSTFHSDDGTAVVSARHDNAAIMTITVFFFPHYQVKKYMCFSMFFFVLFEGMKCYCMNPVKTLSPEPALKY